MKEYLKYQEDDSTALLNSWLNGVLPSGVYCGFDALDFQADMILRLTQSLAPEHIDMSGNGSKVGVVRTKQGVILAEDQNINFDIAPTTTLPRIDVIYIQYQYQAVANPPLPFYSILKGTPSSTPTAPDLTTPALQVKIAELYLPANCETLNEPGVRYIKSPSPILYRNPQSLVIVKTGTAGPLPTQSLIFTNYVKIQDTKNEFNTTTGIFTAIEDGFYFASITVRFDFGEAGTGRWFGMCHIEKFNANSNAWEVVNSVFHNTDPGGYYQANKTLIGITYVKKGEKIRFKIENPGDAPINSYDNNVFIFKMPLLD
ncbi:MAG: hypothetical protein MUC49_15560 [Raineya sp.]|jgi:hypothetical protein|nr:hypothetical protein [Raineya sp.]